MWQKGTLVTVQDAYLVMGKEASLKYIGDMCYSLSLYTYLWRLLKKNHLWYYSHITDGDVQTNASDQFNQRRFTFIDVTDKIVISEVYDK